MWLSSDCKQMNHASEQLDYGDGDQRYFEDEFESAHDAESSELTEPPEIIQRNKILYHGSPNPGIALLEAAYDTTVGAGVYLTGAVTAAKYAEHRGNQLDADLPPGKPTLYEVEIPYARLVNFYNSDTAREKMHSFSAVLQQALEDLPGNSPWYEEAGLLHALANIELAGHPGMIREAAVGNGVLFSNFLQESGYDGLRTLEGGEGEIGDHETYVIFDPRRVYVRSGHLLRP